MKKRLLFAAFMTAFFLNSCAIFINDDDDSEHDHSNKSKDTVTITIISHSRNILEP
jgi:protein involved in sex pheromone biosynthesis